jgi:hypothetical protein
MADLSINQKIREALRNPKSELFTSHTADYIKSISESQPRNIDQVTDQFDSYQEGLVNAVKSNKFNNLQKTLANRDITNFFKLYEAGFALEVQWAEMEA